MQIQKKTEVNTYQISGKLRSINLKLTEESTKKIIKRFNHIKILNFHIMKISK